MRSTAHSLFMTMLLLVPISAVPLMAIFGVPQFTPVVPSPLEETEDDEDWDRPARKKTRTVAEIEPADDHELDIPVDETLSWDESPQERPRPLKKSRPATRSASGTATADIETAFGETEAKSPARKKRPSTRPIPAEFTEDDPQIQTIVNEVVEEESSRVESAVHLDSQDVAAQNESAEMSQIPGYRRQRPGSRDHSDSVPEKTSPRGQRNSSSAEPLTWSKAVQRLNDYGIRNFRLDSRSSGEFMFTCSFTPSNSPHVTRKFEAEADDPLKAVEKVLGQIEDASQQRTLASPRRLAETRSVRVPE